jgi:hypothetical protein
MASIINEKSNLILIITVHNLGRYSFRGSSTFSISSAPNVTLPIYFGNYILHCVDKYLRGYSLNETSIWCMACFSKA